MPLQRCTLLAVKKDYWKRYEGTKEMRKDTLHWNARVFNVAQNLEDFYDMGVSGGTDLKGDHP